MHLKILLFQTPYAVLTLWNRFCSKLWLKRDYLQTGLHADTTSTHFIQTDIKPHRASWDREANSSKSTACAFGIGLLIYSLSSPGESWAGSEAAVEDVGGAGSAHYNNSRISNPLESLSPQGEQSGYMLVKLSSARQQLFCSCCWFITTSTVARLIQVHLKMSGEKIVWGSGFIIKPDVYPSMRTALFCSGKLRVCGSMLSLH